MKAIWVTSQRDKPDTLVIADRPWFRTIVEKAAASYNPRFGWDDSLWSSVLFWAAAKDRELVEVPIAHSCDVSEKLWPKGVGCYHGSWCEACGGPCRDESDDDDRGAA